MNTNTAPLTQAQWNAAQAYVTRKAPDLIDMLGLDKPNPPTSVPEVHALHGHGGSVHGFAGSWSARDYQ